MGKRVLIAGFGSLGQELSKILVEDEHKVTAIRRTPEETSSSIEFLKADLSNKDSLNCLKDNFDQVVYCAAADNFSEEAYHKAYVLGLKNLIEKLTELNCNPQIIFTSSTGVYAQTDGEWVNESSETKPSSFSGKKLLEAEKLLLESSFDSVILRLAGIYGKPNNRLIRQVKSGTINLDPNKQLYSNRIHIKDCAGIVHHLMQLDNPKEIYIGVDDEPTERKEVTTWLAKQLGVLDLKFKPSSKTEYQASRQANNKRCTNKSIKQSGYKFIYPDFRAGYKELISREGGTQ